ncbi:glycosyltransferase [Aurantiacibacter zhengii]|uniref:Glycosyltransferase family 2 protein n=1 Tax=Aurantiacibacter zhengii TaxID=2307003 RepID=A0A418NN44_9SPHN|nr:glycosyltransferase family A protein [Aurantiacibacter zhengii]RIV83051.1 glycosyltransferase family 2 protein [Aurantiacibacter zhengii]
MSQTPKISVVIPVWNGERYMRKLLDALTRQTAMAESFEVIVVDNGSTDRTSEIVSGYTFVTLLSEAKPGSYRARNRALEIARGEYVLFTDADCVPDPNWLEEALRISEKSADNEIHAGRITLFQEEKCGKYATLFESLQAFNQESNVAKQHCVTANWLCKKDLLVSNGGFRADLLSGGDFECSRRLIGCGARIVYAPNLVVAHPTRADLASLVHKRRRVLGGSWTLEKDKGTSPLKLLASPVQMFLGQSKMILRSDIGWRDRPGVLAIAGSVAVAGVFEVLRLITGQPPHRS